MKHCKRSVRLIRLGRASAETRGGPMGHEDSNRTFWYQLGLTRD